MARLQLTLTLGAALILTALGAHLAGQRVRLDGAAVFGTATFGNGTAAAPSIAPTSAPTNGIFFSSGVPHISVAGTDTYSFGASVFQTNTSVITNGDITLPILQAVRWSAGTAIKTVTDGLMTITNAAATAGVGFDVTSDGTFKVRDRTQAAGTVDVPTIVMGATAIASLGTPANGTIRYCNDCTVTTAATCPATQASCVCAGSGTGAFARRINGAWYCTF